MPGQIVYNVPVIQQGLSPSESLYQMLDALEHLDNVVNDVFDKISSRITEEKNKLAAVNTRIEAAKSKIDRLTGTSQATTVFSPAQYPAPSKLNEFTPLFDGLFNTEMKHSKHKPVEVEKNPLKSVESSDDLREFVQARHREIILSSDTKEFNVEKEKKEGLGRLPNVTSVSSLLLFNSNVNLYNSYVIMNNLAVDGDDANANASKKETTKKLGDAPKTVSEGDVLPEIESLYNVTYKPVLGDVPIFNLPNQLPNLPNVANINWSVPDLPEWSSVVVPSKRTNVLNLPTVDANNNSAAASSSSSNMGPLPNISTLTPASDGSALPPPPPPPGPGANTPPQPPPNPGSTPEQSDETADKSTATGEPGDARSSLLDQIRNPNIKLKSSKERELEDENSEKKSKKPMRNTADLFGDLLNALKIRRQGMQGNNEAKPKTENESAPPTEAANVNTAGNPKT